MKALKFATSAEDKEKLILKTLRTPTKEDLAKDGVHRVFVKPLENDLLSP